MFVLCLAACKQKSQSMDLPEVEITGGTHVKAKPTGEGNLDIAGENDTSNNGTSNNGANGNNSTSNNDANGNNGTGNNGSENNIGENGIDRATDDGDSGSVADSKIRDDG